jgi:hypothetical protein
MALNDAVNVMGVIATNRRSIVARILRTAISSRLFKKSDKNGPAQAHPQVTETEERTLLRPGYWWSMPMKTSGPPPGLLERYGCVGETAHDGAEALCMAHDADGEYAVISDIHLPDLNGYEFMLKLKIMDLCLC